MCTHTHMYMKGSRQRQQHNQRACSLCVGVPGAHGLQSPSENWHHVRYTYKKNKKYKNIKKNWNHVRYTVLAVLIVPKHIKVIRWRLP